MPSIHRHSARPFLILVLALRCAATLAQTVVSAESYRLGPRDLVDIKVFEVAELNVTVRVNENGNLTLPLVGDVEAQGLTAKELAVKLQTLLETKYVQKASVNVELKEFQSKPITVLGAIRTPGLLAFSGRWTLVEALSAAGGLNDNQGGIIHVIRRASNGLTDQITIGVDDLLLKGLESANIPIVANDVISVPATAEITIFCLGEVNTPGALSFKSTERVTFLTAIAKAGGMTERASRKVRVRRATQSGDQEMEINYRRVVAGKDADIDLLAGDVIVVKESFF